MTDEKVIEKADARIEEMQRVSLSPVALIAMALIVVMALAVVLAVAL